MARMSAAEAAAKWREKASAATGDYTAGIERTTADPGALAAQAADKWQANVANAKQRFADRVRSVSQADWKRAAVEKGGARYGSGVSAAEPKFSQFASEFFPHLDAVTNRVKGLPSTTLEQRLERMRQQAIGTSQFRRRGMGARGGA